MGGCFPSSLINHKVLVDVKTSLNQNKTKIKSALRFRPVATKSTTVAAKLKYTLCWQLQTHLAAVTNVQFAAPQRTLLARVSISAVRKMIDAKLISTAGLADLELLAREEWAT